MRSALLLLLLAVSLTGCEHHGVQNPSGAEAAAAEMARMPDPLEDKRQQKMRDADAIDRRAETYERQGSSAAEARARAELEYARMKVK